MIDPYLIMADDNTDDIALLEEALHFTGNPDVRIIASNDGRDAWNILSTITVDTVLPRLLILDLNLPYICGDAFVTRMRSVNHLQHIPAIIISSGSIPQHQHADACFEKPGAWDEYLLFARMLCELYFSERPSGLMETSHIVVNYNISNNHENST